MPQPASRTFASAGQPVAVEQRLLLRPDRVGLRREIADHRLVKGTTLEATVRGQGTTANLVINDARLRAMDEQGIDMEALSINPNWYATDRELAARIIKIQNEKLAELCATKPDRFVAFATVALQHPDLAAQQLEEGIKKLGLRGGSIGASVNGEELSARRFGSVLGQGGGTWSVAVHAPAGDSGTPETSTGERHADQCDRKSAGYGHRSLSFDLRQDAGSFSAAQDLCSPRRGLSAVLRGSVRSRVCDVSGQLHQQEC